MAASGFANRQEVMKIILGLIYILTSTSGLILFKYGSGKMETFFAFKNGAVQFQMNFASVLGLFLYVASFVIFMTLVAKHDVSFLLPILTGCANILVFWGAAFFLREKISVMTIVGTLLVVSGVLIMNIGKR
jgi:multidrug transporter EmrE-like cation transporter